jgi:hypothetical protein
MARCRRQPVIAMRCSADDADQPVVIDGRRPLSMPQQSSRRGALKGIITAAILAMGGSFLCHMLHCRIRWLELGPKTIAHCIA